MLGMYGVTWFPLKSYIRTKIKVSKKENPKRIRYKSNQEDQKQKKKNVSVHPDIELEKSSHHLGLGYKACLHFSPLTFHIWCLLMLFSVFIFISSLIIEKEHLASFCCTKQEEKSSSVCAVCWCSGHRSAPHRAPVAYVSL